MKKVLLSGIFCLSLATAVMAQTKDEKEVAAAVETLRKAMVDADKTTLAGITVPELSYGHSSGKVQDQTAFIAALVSGESDFVRIDLTNQSVKVVGNTAIVRHTLSAQTNDSGKPGTVKLDILLVWVKQHGQWKLLARQAVKVPVQA